MPCREDAILATFVAVDTKLSIVIPALNSMETIERCLQSVSQYTASGDVEVILADNGSTDGTVEKASKFGVRIVRVPIDNFVSQVRNRGAAVARASFIAFLDSDCLISPDWCQTVLTSLEDRRTGIVGSRCGPTNSPSWVERVWQSAYLDDQSRKRQVVEYVPSGSMALRKDLFDEVGGFDESLETGEDPDLCRRVCESGFDIVEDRGMECVHLGNPQTLSAFFNREAWHGRGVRLQYANGQVSGGCCRDLCILHRVARGDCTFGLGFCDWTCGSASRVAGSDWGSGGIYGRSAT